MIVRYLGERPASLEPVGSDPVDVEPGQEIEVSDSLGENLVQQVDKWAVVEQPDVEEEVDG